MSIEAMKQALEALETLNSGDSYKTHNAATALRQAIAEAEMQEAVAFVSGYYGGQCVILPIYKNKLFSPGTALYTAPVHASDMSEEHVHKSDKDTLIKQAEEAFESAKEKGWVGLDGDIPDLGLVTEEFYNGMLCAEDILRRRNT